MSDRRQQFLLNLVVFAVLCGAVWFTFSRARSAPFFYDDYTSIVDNPTIRQLWPLADPLNPPMLSSVTARPLVNLSFAANFHFGQLDPTGYRVVNMAIHALAAMLLFGIARRTLELDACSHLRSDASSPAWAAAIAFAIALLWAVHPLQTDAVCYATQRTELMMGLCYLATLYCSIRFWQAVEPFARRGWLVLAVTICALGMASKESMITVPVIVLLYEYTFLQQGVGEMLRKSWPLYAGLFGTWALLFYLIHDMPRSNSVGFHLSVGAYEWWLTQSQVLAMYLRLVFWPWPLMIHYELPYAQSAIDVWPCLLLIAAMAAGTAFALWRRWPIGFLGAWFFIILSPTTLIPIVTEMAAERRMYLPLAAVVAVVVVGAYRLLSWILTSRVAVLSAVAATVAVAVVFSCVSYHRLAAYQSESLIWEDVLAHFPESEVVQISLAAALRNEDRDAEALPHYLEAVRLNPELDMFRFKYANALNAVGDRQEAIRQYAETIRLNPEYAEAYFNLGVLLKELGRDEEAIAQYAAAVRLSPDDAEFRNNYGNALRALKRYPEAVEQFERALVLNPRLRNARYNLAITFESMGNRTNALQEFKRLIEQHPDDGPGQLALANALLAAHEPDNAVEHYRRAIELKPDSMDARNNLGAALLELGRTDEAIEQFQQIVRVTPDSAVGLFNLADALKTAGRQSDALPHARRALELASTNHQTDLAEQIQTWLSANEKVDSE